MNLCSHNHDEVCYDGGTCPACAVADDLQEKIDILEMELKDANSTISDLERQLEDKE